MTENERVTRVAPPGWGTRYTVALMLFLSSLASYSMRINISLAIVAMVNRTSIASGPPFSITNETDMFNNITVLKFASCPHLTDDYVSVATAGNNNSLFEDELVIAPPPVKPKEGEFNWSEKEQGIILGAYFWGYIVTQIPGGLLSKRYGGKWPLGLGLLISGIFCLITPWIARVHTGLLIFSRVMQGAGSGLHASSQTALIASWSPPNERSVFGNLAFGGIYFGTAATLVISGYLIHNDVMGGWPSVFYFSGVLTIIWFIFWCFTVSSRPAEHPRISSGERQYIQQTLGSRNSQQPRMSFPWRNILTSLPLWATLISHFCTTWGMYTLLTELPTYMKTVLNFNIKKNSWMSALPYLTSWLFGLVFAQIADMLLRRNRISIVWIRKSAQIIAHGGAALALIATSYTGCDRVATVSLLIVAVGVTGTVFSGCVINYVDLAPNHASLLLGIANTLASCTGIAAPYVAGLLINNDPSIENWRMVFLISAGVYIFGLIFYTLFASGEEQPWNRPNNERAANNGSSKKSTSTKKKEGDEEETPMTETNGLMSSPD